MIEQAEKITIEQIRFLDFVKRAKKKEGLVILGAGEPHEEWITGITKLLQEEKILDGELEDIWSEFFLLKSTGGRHDLVMVFKKNPPINIGKMAIWRLQFGDISWISDFIVNYRKHYSKKGTK